ncbi:MAG: 50S ribosomal protein L23 [Muribaculaceae bacterium]
MEFKIEPIVTEKANSISEKLNRYSFRVSPDANKFQIKSMIEKLYSVKVVAVNTANYSGKCKSRNTKSGLIKGKVASFKKALITVAEGEKIDFYSNI